MKIVIGLLIALAIGGGCRWSGVPLPAPGVLLGAMLVLAMTVGYSTADRLMARRAVERKCEPA
jgi:XapX domain-containing protein